MYSIYALFFFVFVGLGHAAFDLGWGDDSDLTSFVTRPEIKAPLFNVALYKPESVTPGYWFLGPYAEIQQKEPAPRYYNPCQTGPHIYDGYGNLVWSGACQVKNQNTCDFRAWNFNGTDYLSAILYKYKNDTVGRGVIMDSSYQVIDTIMPPPELPGFNMHELNLINNRTSALYITFRPEYVDLSDLPDQRNSHGWINNMGIREVDLRSGRTTFEWWAWPEVSLAESNVAITHLNGPWPSAWNWFHGNSIAKNSHGDYLVSSRFTDTIFKISGETGRILWRLGGRFSDFEQLDLNFSRQHDAQWIESECDGATETLTLLDNGSDGITHTSNTSSALKVVLDRTRMTARVDRRWVRPDNARSDLRGNFQTLPGGNVFAAWSDNGYVSEFTGDGELVMAAEFGSTRFVTYRAYKANFTGKPSEPPAMKAFAYGADEAGAVTVVYASWNGATEVDAWNIRRGSGELIGVVPRVGFETRFQARGFEPELYVEGVAVDGSVLGRTRDFVVDRPEEWDWEWEVLETGQVEEQRAPKTEL